MSQQTPIVVNNAAVELIGLGKNLTFRVVGSDSQELPVGSSFQSRPYLWGAAFDGTHPHVKVDIQEGHVYFVGKFKALPGRWNSMDWRPFR
jgi:hypothetical protein